jgi:hypothetical protein
MAFWQCPRGVHLAANGTGVTPTPWKELKRQSRIAAAGLFQVANSRRGLKSGGGEVRIGDNCWFPFHVLWFRRMRYGYCSWLDENIHWILPTKRRRRRHQNIQLWVEECLQSDRLRSIRS